MRLAAMRGEKIEGITVWRIQRHALITADWFNGSVEEVLLVSERWLFSEAKVHRIEPCVPLFLGIPQVVDRLLVSEIIFMIRGGLCWRDAPYGYGRHRTS
jgi:hypothetical protein